MSASITENFSNGGITLLKTLGAVAGAAVLLYLLLLLIKVVGNRLEKKTYELYIKKCEKEGIAPISFEEFYAKRASGEKVLWKRDDKESSSAPPYETNSTVDPAPSDNDETTQYEPTLDKKEDTAVSKPDEVENNSETDDENN